MNWTVDHWIAFCAGGIVTTLALGCISLRYGRTRKAPKPTLPAALRERQPATRFPLPQWGEVCRSPLKGQIERLSERADTDDTDDTDETESHIFQPKH